MSNWYYVNANGQQVGPVSLESLAGAGLTPNTMVWTDGMSQWVTAGSVQQLSHLFGAVPPPPGGYHQQGYQNPGYQQHGYQQPVGVRPNNNMTWAIISIFLCTIGGIVATIYASKVNDLWARGDYQGAQESANTAKTWCIISTVTGALGCVGGFLSALAG